jgi:hypothetical protein
MTRRDIHGLYDFFEYVRAGDSVPAVDRNRIDIAVLDMNHSWPNVGHDSVIHAILEAAEASRDALIEAGVKVRAISFDVRRRATLPAKPDGRFTLYVGTGGPGHLDPRLNDGISEWAQGVVEQPTWEAPLFRLFDSIFKHPKAALIGICHTFGLMCRWTGMARPVFREAKSSGLLSNVLSEAGMQHPWFSRFANELPDHRHYRVIDNRFFDLMLDDACGADCLAFENDDSAALTMLEFARGADGRMPRVFGMNHHPEIIDREHVLEVLDEKRAHGEVSERWYRERADTMTDLLQGENERQSRLTSEFTFLAPLRYYVSGLVAERCTSSSPPSPLW